MKLLINILVVLTMAIFSINAFAKGGVVVGNGGDTLVCEPNANSQFNGLFSLDYLLEYKSNSPLRNVTTWEESEANIVRILYNLSPALAVQFRDFTNDILRQNSLRTRIWNKTPLIETDIKDEEMLRLLPSNCDVKKLKQTVIRTYDKNYVYYLFNESIVSQLKNSYPLQFSFLMVHEWLWDFTKDVRILRKMNWLIHSRKFENITKEELFDIFSRYNFFNKVLDPCNRSAKIQNLFVRSCQNTDIANLIPSTVLNMSRLSQPYGFRPGDFRGLYNTETLNLSGNPGLLDLLSPFSFQDMKNLKKLDLSNSGIVELPFWFFSDFKYISELDLANNSIKKIPTSFREFPMLKKLWISKTGFDLSSLSNLPSQTEVIFK